jgi:hypothetical protein
MGGASADGYLEMGLTRSFMEHKLSAFPKPHNFALCEPAPQDKTAVISSSQLTTCC